MIFSVVCLLIVELSALASAKGIQYVKHHRQATHSLSLRARTVWRDQRHRRAAVEASRQHADVHVDPQGSLHHATAARDVLIPGSKEYKAYWGERRRPPPFDFEVLEKEMSALRRAAASNRSLVKMENIDGTGTAALTEICVPASVGGHDLVGDAAFQAQARRGHEEAKSKGIVIAGLMRDIGDTAAHVINTWHSVGKAFARYFIILIENNSKDQTKDVLRKECKSQHMSCLELDIPEFARHAQGQGNPSRVRHFTALRQVLLEQIRQHVSSSSAPASWEFLLLFDGDFFAGGSKGFHPSAVDALFGLQSLSGNANGKTFAEVPWDVICGNQLANWPEPGRYRDDFAFRNSTWRAAYEELLARDKYFKGNQIVPVKSCFSGMALYSLRAILSSGCNYTSYEGEDVCEHVVFNKCLAKHGHGKVGIYPPWAVRVNDQGVVRQTCAKMGGQAFDLAENLPVYTQRPLVRHPTILRPSKRRSAARKSKAMPSGRSLQKLPIKPSSHVVRAAGGNVQLSRRTRNYPRSPPHRRAARRSMRPALRKAAPRRGHRRARR